MTSPGMPLRVVHGAVKDLRPGIRQPDRKTLLKQAQEGAAILWCRDCDYFWREWADPKSGWINVALDPETGETQDLPKSPGHDGCPNCGCDYVVWENYPEWLKTTRPKQ